MSMKYLSLLLLYIPMTLASQINESFYITTDINMIDFYGQYNVETTLNKSKLVLIYDEVTDRFKNETIEVKLKSTIPSSESGIGISYSYVLSKNESSCVSPMDINMIIRRDFIDVYINGELLSLNKNSSPFVFNSITKDNFMASTDIINIYTNKKLKDNNDYILTCSGSIEFNVELEL